MDKYQHFYKGKHTMSTAAEHVHTFVPNGFPKGPDNLISHACTICKFEDDFKTIRRIDGPQCNGPHDWQCIDRIFTKFAKYHYCWNCPAIEVLEKRKDSIGKTTCICGGTEWMIAQELYTSPPSYVYACKSCGVHRNFEVTLHQDQPRVAELYPNETIVIHSPELDAILNDEKKRTELFETIENSSDRFGNRCCDACANNIPALEMTVEYDNVAIQCVVHRQTKCKFISKNLMEKDVIFDICSCDDAEYANEKCNAMSAASPYRCLLATAKDYDENNQGAMFIGRNFKKVFE